MLKNCLDTNYYHQNLRPVFSLNMGDILNEKSQKSSTGLAKKSVKKFPGY